MTASVAADDITAAASGAGIALALHGGDQDRAQCRHAGDRRARDLGEEHRAPIDHLARPPRIQPNSAQANAISRREIPEAFMIAPARMKSGIAISGKLVAPL